VAAICYRRQGATVEFLLVNTNGGNKWTFPKGSPEARLSHSQSRRAPRRPKKQGPSALIEPRHFHLYIHSRAVFLAARRRTGVRGQSFLMEINQMHRS